MDKPTYEKFKRYCVSKNYGTDKFIKSLYDYLDDRKWKKSNGEEPVNWMILTDANYGVFNAKGKFSKAIREKLAEKSENFDPVEPFPDVHTAKSVTNITSRNRKGIKRQTSSVCVQD